MSDSCYRQVSADSVSGVRRDNAYRRRGAANRRIHLNPRRHRTGGHVGHCAPRFWRAAVSVTTCNARERTKSDLRQIPHRQAARTKATKCWGHVRGGHPVGPLSAFPPSSCRVPKRELHPICCVMISICLSPFGSYRRYSVHFFDTDRVYTRFGRRADTAVLSHTGRPRAESPGLEDVRLARAYKKDGKNGCLAPLACMSTASVCFLDESSILSMGLQRAPSSASLSTEPELGLHKTTHEQGHQFHVSRPSSVPSYHNGARLPMSPELGYLPYLGWAIIARGSLFGTAGQHTRPWPRSHGIR